MAIKTTHASTEEIIPLSVPNMAGNEWTYIKDCLDTGWVSSVGSYVNRFEADLAQFTGAKYAVATMNGTAAIHLSLLLSGAKRDDYILAPNITFIASCNAIHYTGADPLLIDIDKDTWQMDLDILEDFLENKTFQKNSETFSIADNRRIAGILPVHVLGNMCNMERLLTLSEKYHLFVVEDSTEALGSYFRGKHAGTFARIGTFSFNGNKIITTGGGGMIVTDDPELARKAKHLSTQAKVDAFQYNHDEIGYNYRLVNVLAAMGVAQLEQLPSFLRRKKVIDQTYRNALENEHLAFQQVGQDVIPNNWLHTMKVSDQQGMINHLLANQIQCRPFWVPMNQLRMFSHLPYIHATDVSDEVYQSCISIPSSTHLTEEQLARVIQVIRDFKN